MSIVVGPGVSPSHFEALEAVYGTFEEVDRQVRKGTMTKLTVGAHLVHVGRVIKERARGISAGRGIPKTDAVKLGFLHDQESRDALDIVISLCGRHEKVAVLQRGSEALPVIQTAGQ